MFTNDIATPPGIQRWRRLTLGASKTDVDLDRPPEARASHPGEPPFCPELPVLERMLAQLGTWLDGGDLLPEQRRIAEEALPVLAARLEQVRSLAPPVP
jgi:hypothetical protein